MVYTQHGTVSTGPLSAELQACKYISGSMVNESLQSYRGLMSPLGDLTVLPLQLLVHTRMTCMFGATFEAMNRRWSYLSKYYKKSRLSDGPRGQPREQTTWKLPLPTTIRKILAIGYFLYLFITFQWFITLVSINVRIMQVCK